MAVVTQAPKKAFKTTTKKTNQQMLTISDKQNKKQPTAPLKFKTKNPTSIQLRKKN